MKLTIVAAVVVALAAATRPAAAQDAGFGIGLYAPSAPFGGTSDRVQFITKLADHLSAELGVTVTGRVYSSGSALSDALKKGDVEFAVVDAPYLTMRGNPWKVLATAARAGGGTAAWQIVGSGARLSDLRGRKLAIAQINGKEAAFVTGVLLEGEVDDGFFGSLVATPDAVSAVKAVALGRADAAVVPVGVDTEGLGVVVRVRAVGWPSLVADGKVDAKLQARVVAAAKAWSGAGPFTGFTGATGHALSNGRPRKRPVMATTPPRKLQVKGILSTRAFTIPSSDLARYVTAPAPPRPRPAPQR